MFQTVWCYATVVAAAIAAGCGLFLFCRKSALSEDGAGPGRRRHPGRARRRAAVLDAEPRRDRPLRDARRLRHPARGDPARLGHRARRIGPARLRPHARPQLSRDLHRRQCDGGGRAATLPRVAGQRHRAHLRRRAPHRGRGAEDGRDALDLDRARHQEPRREPGDHPHQPGPAARPPRSTSCSTTSGPRSRSRLADLVLHDKVSDTRIGLGTGALLLLAVLAIVTASILSSREQEQRTENRREIESRNRALALAGEMANIGHWRLTVDPPGMAWSDQVFRIHGLEPGDVPPLAKAIDFYVEEDRARGPRPSSRIRSPAARIFGLEALLRARRRPRRRRHRQGRLRARRYREDDVDLRHLHGRDGDPSVRARRSSSATRCSRWPARSPTSAIGR